jgi:hypothetical protein
MKYFIGSCAALAVAASAQAQGVIAQWNFDTDSLAATLGSGSASTIGGASSAFASGNGGGRGWNTSSYQAQGAGSGTAGVQFLLDTTGFQDLQFSFDHRASGTGSRWAQVDYTLDGGASWVTGFWNNGGGLSPHDFFYTFTVDFSGVAGANDNAGFGVRIVSIFSPLAFNQNATLSYGADAAYMRANAQATFSGTAGTGTGDYAGGGTWRFDNVTLSGTVIPAPGAFALLGVAGLLGSRRRRAA